MSNTLSVRLPDGLRDWLEETARRTGLPLGQVVREYLERARSQADERPWMRFAGAVKGLPRDLSTRKGFSRK
jgi:predicted transcriptional regulator